MKSYKKGIGMAMSSSIQPIIIIGMHRSGTSMLFKMLKDLGLFIGIDLDDNLEARFFVNRNEKILNICNATWDNPEPLDNLINNYHVRRKITNYLHDDIRSFSILSFLGPKKFFKYKSLLKLDFKWGWKDPRNTFLLPFWLDIFPKAKFIHIYRNGIDVANSLAYRELQRINGALKRRRKFPDIMDRQASQIKSTGYLIYFLRKIVIRYEKIDPLYKYEEFKIHPVISLDKGFDVWCAYMKRASYHLNNIKNDILEIRYEDFLMDPGHWLKRVSEFCSLSGDEERINSIVADVNPNRRYAFRHKPSLMNFYNKVKSNYWICKLGYDLLD